MQLPHFPQIQFPKFGLDGYKKLSILLQSLYLMILVASLVAIMTFVFWPPTSPEAQVEIVKALGVAIWIALGVLGLNFLVLAIGRPDKVEINGPNGIGGEIRFDGPDKPPEAPET